MAGTTRIVYSNSPLRLLTAEVKLAYEPTFNSRNVRDEFAARLREAFPNVIEEPAPGPASESTEPLTQVRMTSSDLKCSVSLNANSLSLLMAGDAYTGLDEFIPVLERAYAAALAASRKARVRRVGLRYVNEIRVPAEGFSPREWSKWINGKMLSPSEMPAGEPEAIIGHLHFAPTPESEIVVQYGDARGRSIITDDVPVKLREVPSDVDFFVIDLDGGWEPDEPVALQPDQLLERLTALHGPIEAGFEWSITDDARNEFGKELNLGFES